jgi:6-phosphogluconolactonase/glucosamine-6-phosphate isomerase/deaminase
MLIGGTGDLGSRRIRAAQRFADMETLSATLANQIAASLAAAVGARGVASLVVSGGRTPVRLFEILRTLPLEWARVCIALADERWVDPQDAASNEHLVRDVLLKDRAAAARFHGLKNAAPTPDLGAVSAWETFARVPRPFDAVLLGMGDDGHTASLFPRSPNLPSALNQAAVAGCAAPALELEFNRAARFAPRGAAHQRRIEVADAGGGVRRRRGAGHAGARRIASNPHAGRRDVVAVA